MIYDDFASFDVEDPFQCLSLLNDGLLPPPPIVRIEGWQYYVNKEIVTKPLMPSIDVLNSMTAIEKKEFAKKRKKYHSEMPLMETPTLAQIHKEALRVAALNYSGSPGARMGIVLDGLGTVGKSSIVMELGKKYELSWRKNILPKLKCAGIHNSIPVIYITLIGELSVKDFNRLIVSFMGINAPSSATVSWLSNQIIDTTQACGTSLIIIDDIHFLKMCNRTAQVINNHLKFLANCISATFIYSGIDVEGSGLMKEGNSTEKAFVSQTQHRFKCYSIAPFSKDSPDLKPLLNSFEASLALQNQLSGTLANISDYIHDRTGGFMGAISNLIREGANLAIDNGSERVNRVVFDKIRLDFASEAHRKTTISRS